MSNYDWYDYYDPYEDDKKNAARKHCGRTDEHNGHTYGTEYIRTDDELLAARLRGRSVSRVYTAPPFYKCDGTPPRMIRAGGGVILQLHDNGKVTWFKPDGDVDTALRNNKKMRKAASRVDVQTEE